MQTSASIVTTESKVVNVASVPHRSPFRYPGGKTWLVPHVRTWCDSLPFSIHTFVEPFAGGGIVGLSMLAEGKCDRLSICEIDAAVASVWHTILGVDREWLIDAIQSFRITRDSVIRVLSKSPSTLRDLAFQTLVRNRVQRGGIMAPGASLVKNGENGKGVASRWYPQTLARRISEIGKLSHRIDFEEGDGLTLLRRFARNKTFCFFIDPPYTAGGKRAGNRLYKHNSLNHQLLFELSSRVKGAVMLTYDDSPEIRLLTEQRGFSIDVIPMKNTHHEVMKELVITNMDSIDQDECSLFSRQTELS